MAKADPRCSKLMNPREECQCLSTVQPGHIQNSRRSMAPRCTYQLKMQEVEKFHELSDIQVLGQYTHKM